MNNIRVTRKPFFKEYTFHKEESGLYLIVEGSARGFEAEQEFYEELLTPFEYSIIQKVYKFCPNKRNFARGTWEKTKTEIKDILGTATYIIGAFSLEEVEFIDIDKETFDKWKTFRKWHDIVEENNND